ncbi:hypothetical protein KNR05_19570, partial [Acinetobacter baumannii]|uniref:Ig-like domain-containing protein n=1 Tax=Acinetobacter baumannii TaxID=470 RepID=UPI0020A0145E
DPVSGQAEPGSTVTVTYPDGTTATVVAGTDGSWSVPNVTVTYPDGTTATVVAGTDGSWSVPNPGNLVDGDTVTA